MSTVDILKLLEEFIFKMLRQTETSQKISLKFDIKKYLLLNFESRYHVGELI